MRTHTEKEERAKKRYRRGGEIGGGDLSWSLWPRLHVEVKQRRRRRGAIAPAEEIEPDVAGHQGPLAIQGEPVPLVPDLHPNGAAEGIPDKTSAKDGLNLALDDPHCGDCLVRELFLEKHNPFQSYEKRQPVNNGKADGAPTLWEPDPCLSRHGRRHNGSDKRLLLQVFRKDGGKRHLPFILQKLVAVQGGARQRECGQIQQAIEDSPRGETRVADDRKEGYGTPLSAGQQFEPAGGGAGTDLRAILPGAARPNGRYCGDRVGGDRGRAGPLQGRRRLRTGLKGGHQILQHAEGALLFGLVPGLRGLSVKRQRAPMVSRVRHHHDQDRLKKTPREGGGLRAEFFEGQSQEGKEEIA